MSKEEKVISKNTKGTRKNFFKKESLSKRFINLIKKHKVLSGIITLIIIFIITLYIINYGSINRKVITINNIDYTQNDFSIYLFSAKYNYFDGNVDVNENDLKVVYDEETNMTVGQYLKEVALSDIKTSSAIRMLADKYSISLLDVDYEELDKEKTGFINSLGGKSNFKKFLKKNNTTEEAYDNMTEADKLYKKIVNNVFGEGKINDLTSEERENAKSNYKQEYFKIKQIILTTIDINTGKSLTQTTINQKETLANKIVEEVKSGANFDDLIKKYSEDAIDKEPPYETYYKSEELLSDLEKEILTLKPGEVSKPIKTKYAYHIIERQQLDDGKLNEYYDELREEKCIDELQEQLDKLQIIYYDAYKNIKVK